jgi:hypothetical protein
MKTILPYPRVYETTEISKSLLPQMDCSLGEGNFYPLLFKAFEDSMAELMLDIILIHELPYLADKGEI